MILFATGLFLIAVSINLFLIRNEYLYAFETNSTKDQENSVLWVVIEILIVLVATLLYTCITDAFYQVKEDLDKFDLNLIEIQIKRD
jgi:hypothetical protein